MARTIDPKLTDKIGEWLQTEPARRDIVAGAELVLALTRNRALYNTALRHPDRVASKIEYELRKFYLIRLDGRTAADVARMEPAVMNAVEAIISTDAELPEATRHWGKRPDHDTLPPEVRILWEENARRRRLFTRLFAELKSMNHLRPCDRYEKLTVMAEAEETYRKTMKAYDEWTPDRQPEIPLEGTKEHALAVNAARKTIGKYKKLLATLPPDDADRRRLCCEKISVRLEELNRLGAVTAAKTLIELRELGVNC